MPLNKFKPGDAVGWVVVYGRKEYVVKENYKCHQKCKGKILVSFFALTETPLEGKKKYFHSHIYVTNFECYLCSKNWLTGLPDKFSVIFENYTGDDLGHEWDIEDVIAWSYVE